MVSPAGAVEFSGRADCSLEQGQGSTAPVSRTAHPLASSISNWVGCDAGSTIDTGTKVGGSCSWPWCLLTRSDPDAVIGGPELAASISRRRCRQ